MNREYDKTTGVLTRVCTPCLEGTSETNNYVRDEHFGKVQCLYCDSYSTEEQAPKWGWFTCRDCGETFRRF